MLNDDNSKWWWNSMMMDCKNHLKSQVCMKQQKNKREKNIESQHFINEKRKMIMECENDTLCLYWMVLFMRTLSHTAEYKIFFMLFFSIALCIWFLLSYLYTHFSIRICSSKWTSFRWLFTYSNQLDVFVDWRFMHIAHHIFTYTLIQYNFNCDSFSTYWLCFFSSVFIWNAFKWRNSGACYRFYIMPFNYTRNEFNANVGEFCIIYIEYMLYVASLYLRKE